MNVGFDVCDRPGYDTHGLPTENEVEKELNIVGTEGIMKVLELKKNLKKG